MRVLILIVMDDPLRGFDFLCFTNNLLVLILIVMDDPLRAIMHSADDFSDNGVLILIVMDDPLRGIRILMMRLFMDCLNPYCNG